MDTLGEWNGLEESRMMHAIFSELRKVLCIGAHSDDIEIGCGGTILKLVQSCPEIEFLWFVASAESERRHEAQESAAEFLRNAHGAELRFGGFRESYFPDQWREIKAAVENLKNRFEPDLIFTHHRDDRHQDHKTISDLTWNSFRNHMILEYEVPKYDGDLGQPNIFSPLDPEVCRIKGNIIVRHFHSQISKNWFTESTFQAMARIRGIECASEYAEAFYGRKFVISNTGVRHV